MDDLTLNNGVHIPPIGLGVFQSAPEETAHAVEAALGAGYRHIDTAAGYGNEREVGEGIRRSGLDRDDVFVETKVWVSDYGYDETLHAFGKSAKKLGVSQIDLLILHQPMPQHFDRTMEAYRALEHARQFSATWFSDYLQTGTRVVSGACMPEGASASRSYATTLARASRR
ncbi:MAG TPA: aldo/keto reductase [Ilumatobacter sp.]|nr:aldo/keto reductase [Ilumatobacter sp.]